MRYTYLEKSFDEGPLNGIFMRRMQGEDLYIEVESISENSRSNYCYALENLIQEKSFQILKSVHR